MLKQLLVFASLTFSLALAGDAMAQAFTPSLSLLYFKEGSTRSLESTPDTGDSQKDRNTYTFVSLGVCYRLDAICLGLKYLQGEVETKTTVSSWSQTGKAVYTAPGLTVGYSGAQGIVAHATWLLSAKKTLTDQSTTYFAKSAWVAELGYGFTISSVRIGPLVGIYNFKWKDKDVAGQKTALKPTESDDFILPQLALWVDL